MENKKFITTRKLKILRPFYGEEIEKEITKDKKDKLEKSKDKNQKDGQLDKSYWKELKKKHPEIIDWNELRDVFVQLQRTISVIYNWASAKLYLNLLTKGQIKAKKGNEQGAIKYAISRDVYPEIMKRIHNSYIALGIGEKLRASFSGQKLRKIQTGQISSPSVISDKFPIPMWIQKGKKGKGGFKIEDYNGDFILNIPFPEYKYKEKVDKYNPWEKLEFLKTPKKKHIQLILSTLNRKRNEGWNKDWGAEAEIKKVIKGDYKISKIEIAKGKRLNERNYWFVNFVINSERPIKQLDRKKIGAIDVGVSNPVVCAIHNELNRLSIRDNDVIDFTKAELARLKSQRRGDRFRRGGHGIKHKFVFSETIQKKYNERRKKKIEEWASRIVRFFLNNGIGLVFMENIDAKSIKEGSNYFKTMLRVSWPVKEMQKLFERKLEDNGITVKYRNPSFTSQICSKCGKWNNYFNFKYRKENNFPSFKCKDCEYEEYADYNAAKNIANPDFEKIIKKAIPREVREKYSKKVVKLK
jgi:IS605 OrfB family transposase